MLPLAIPAGAQTPAPSPLPAGTNPPADTQTPGYWQLLGIQLPAPPPGADLAPPLPPLPSQSHVPRIAPFLPSARAPVAPSAAFEFHPLVGLSEAYTDNFNLTPDNKVQNFRTTVTPGFNLLVNAPRTQGTVAGGFGIAQDTVNRFGDFSLFPSLNAAVKHEFDPRLTVYVADTFVRNDQPALANQFGLQQQRQTFTSNSLSLSADWLVDRVATQAYYQLSTFFSTSNTISNILGGNAAVPLGVATAIKGGYELSLSQVTGDTSGNSTGNLVWGAVARKLNPFAVAGVSATYSLQSFDSTRIGNGSVFTTYELPGRLSLSASLGYSVLNSDVGDTSAISTNTNASYRLGNAVISVGIFQDFNQTFTTGENFGIVLTRSFWGTFGYALTPFIDASLGASYNDNEPTGVGNTQPAQNTFSARVGFSWRVLPWLTAGLEYTYNRYNSGTSSSSAGTTSAGSTSSIAPENRVTVRLGGSF